MSYRLSWVPFSNLLIFVSRGSSNKTAAKIGYVLSYENIISSLPGLKYKLDFEFSGESWKIFRKYITSMPAFAPDPFLYSKFDEIGFSNDVDKAISVGNIPADYVTSSLLSHNENALLKEIAYDEDDASIQDSDDKDDSNSISQFDHSRDKRRHIYKLEFGAICCKHIKLSAFYHFYKIASNKVIVDCGTMDWDGMMSDTKDNGNWNHEMVQCLMKMADFNSLQNIFEAMQYNPGIDYNRDSEREFLDVKFFAVCCLLYCGFLRLVFNFVCLLIGVLFVG